MFQAIQQSFQDQQIIQSDRTWEQFQWIRRGFDNAPGVKLFRQGIQPALG